MDDVRLKDVRPQTAYTIRSLSFEDWISIFRPRKAPSASVTGVSKEHNIPREYLHFENSEDDWAIVENADRSARWSVIQSGNEFYIVEGFQEDGRVACLVTDVGWDVDNTFQVDVVTGEIVDFAQLDLRPIHCFKPCQVTDNYIIRAHFHGGRFTHWYCWWCFMTCKL